MADDTEQRRAERQAMLAALAPTVQHAANNLLTVLSGTADIMRRTAKDQPSIARAERLTEATQRMEALIRGYMTFARRPLPDPAPTDAALLIGRLAPVIELFLPRGVPLTIEAGADLPQVAVDASALDAALLMLLQVAAPRAVGALRLKLDRGEGVLTLTIEGLPDDAPTGPLEEVAVAAGGGVASRHPMLVLSLPVTGQGGSRPGGAA
jgi:nitrogen-specific signal transduction histidine kinase